MLAHERRRSRLRARRAASKVRPTLASARGEVEARGEPRRRRARRRRRGRRAARRGTVAATPTCGIALRCTDAVRVVARQARLDQREQHRLAEHEAVRRVEVLAHPLGVHVHALDDAAELHQHVVGELQRVGEDDALDRRVRDVALVPQRDVLERRPAGCRAARGRGRRAARTFTGLRLCGIALEPFCAPARNGSSTSRTSVRWR